MKVFKKIALGIGCIIGIVLVLVILLFGYLTLTEFNPAPVEAVEVSQGYQSVSVGDSLSVLSFNIGYAAYDQDENFFMDGGTTVRPESANAVKNNLSGITSIISEQNADITFLQEVDTDSHRSYGINELGYINAALGASCAYAKNYSVSFVPFPVPPIGKVNSGVAIFTDLQVEEASRIALPCPFKWPIRIGNLKRCILEERIPIEGTDRELVLLNFHLEAYDDGEGKLAQTAALYEKLSDEYLKGNAVIAGGDFNQSFDNVRVPEVLYPDDWMPGYLKTGEAPKGFSFAVADNASTCRSLAREFIDESVSQTYIIDGFLVSDNLAIESVKVVDEKFMYSDHNPVRLEVRIK